MAKPVTFRGTAKPPKKLDIPQVFNLPFDTSAIGPASWGPTPPASPPATPVTYGGRMGVSAVPPAKGPGIGLQVELDKTGNYWRYIVPGSGWYSQWRPKNPADTSYAGVNGGKPGGGAGNDVYYDRDFGGWRENGELVGGAMNAYGQPLGTPGPLQVRGPRREGAYAKGAQPLTPELVSEQLQATETYLQNEYDRLDRQKGRKPGRLEHWDPLGYRLQRLQRRKEILQKLAEQMGLGAGAGVESGATSAIVRWNV